ncbi:ATP-dependent Clp protease proteolytic subunit [Devosia sp. 1566]|uniref:ATP-dependent Clp protease proteolytic subunit n=1 Tax=Devosia sp. 1566 TaxID=2499144 RepID=UPI000FD75A30
MSTSVEASEEPQRASWGRRLVQRAAAVDDGAVMRTAFWALLLGTVSVLFVDFRELTQNQAAPLPVPTQPILPPAPATNPEASPGAGTRPAITTSPEVLEGALVIALRPEGELSLTGTLDVGSAERFAAEIAERGEYVQTVVLDSPGGSVVDALAIGSLIHQRGLATKVAAGSLCASSCPIIFASGAERIASPEAAIGVHQIYAAALGGNAKDALRVAGTAMSDAQTTTAQITRHLEQTGVDPALWLHALETPPQLLYYFTPEEMLALRLATRLDNKDLADGTGRETEPLRAR